MDGKKREKLEHARSDGIGLAQGYLVIKFGVSNLQYLQDLSLDIVLGSATAI